MAPEATLRVFLDRSVGTRRVAEGLRDLGLAVQTIVDRYGHVAARRLPDTRWITDASADGYLLLGADLRVRYRPAERCALCFACARYVCFSNGNLTAKAMVDIVHSHLGQLTSASARPGPWVCHLRTEGLARMPLDCTDLDRIPSAPPGE